MNHNDRGLKPLHEALDRICTRILDAGAVADSLQCVGFLSSENGTATLMLETTDEHGKKTEDYVLELKLITWEEASL